MAARCGPGGTHPEGGTVSDVNDTQRQTFLFTCDSCEETYETTGFTPGGPRICIGCAVEEAQRKPTCLRCHVVIEKGPLCEQCELHIKAHRERVLSGVRDKWPAILRSVQERPRTVVPRDKQEV